jgi:hypothetical protein
MMELMFLCFYIFIDLYLEFRFWKNYIKKDGVLRME